MMALSDSQFTDLVGLLIFISMLILFGFVCWCETRGKK